MHITIGGCDRLAEAEIVEQRSRDADTDIVVTDPDAMAFNRLRRPATAACW